MVERKRKIERAKERDKNEENWGKGKAWNRLACHANTPTCCIPPIPGFSTSGVERYTLRPFGHKFEQRSVKSRSLTGLPAGSACRPSLLPWWR